MGIHLHDSIFFVIPFPLWLMAVEFSNTLGHCSTYSDVNWNRIKRAYRALLQLSELINNLVGNQLALYILVSLLYYSSNLASFRNWSKIMGLLFSFGPNAMTVIISSSVSLTVSN